MKKEKFMYYAIDAAEKSFKNGDVPIGAVVVKNDEIIGVGYNFRETTNDISAHAEIMALKNAAQKLNTWHLDGCDLYTTLEPCLMCYSAIEQSRIEKVFIATEGNPKKNYCFSKYLEKPQHFEYGILREESQKLLKTFFKKKRIRRNYD